MKDKFNREINYLRVSVTDLCNLRCRYCMPQHGVVPKKHSEILRYEEMLMIIKQCALMGIKSVRLTGGEPLVRKGIINFISQLADIEELDNISITTNGVLLREYARELKLAGISNVNISIDSLREERFRYITRGGNLKNVLSGIDEAVETGFKSVKLNIVVIKGFNDDELMDFVAIARDKPIYVRFIELMPIGEAEKYNEQYISCEEIRKRLPGLEEVAVDASTGTGPAKYYSIEGYKGLIGFISPISNCFCDRCNRIRLTADGRLMPCLHSDMEINLRPFLDSQDTECLRDAIKHALELKPKKHDLKKVHSINGESDNNRYMSQIGG